MELEQSWEAQGPQLEILGRAETKLPAPLKKRPAARLVAVLLALAAFFGVGGAKLAAGRAAVAASYTAAGQDAFGNPTLGVANELARAADAAANMLKIAANIQTADPVRLQEAQDALAAFNAAPQTPHAQYEAMQALQQALEALNKSVDSSAYIRQFSVFTSSLTLAGRESYNAQAAAWNRTAGAFPANVIGLVIGGGEVELYQ